MSAYPVGGRIITLREIIDLAISHGYVLEDVEQLPGKRALRRGHIYVVLPFFGTEDDDVLINGEIDTYLIERLKLPPADQNELMN